jgi:DNA-binding transcriptional ArsR family regulator
MANLTSEELLAISKPGSDEKIRIEVAALKRAVRTLRAIKHPLRQRMLRIMDEKGKITVTDLYTNMKIEQAVASQQLKILRDAGVVTTTREGKFIHYSVNTNRMEEVARLIPELG